LKEEQRVLILGSGNQKPDITVIVHRTPEENNGILETKSGPNIICWQDTLAGIIQVGKFIDKGRLDSYDSLFVPKNEYAEHRRLAEAVLKSRRKSYYYRGSHQARLFL